MSDVVPGYANFDEILFSPAYAAECLEISTRALRSFEDEEGVEVRRKSRGSVSARVYTPADLFKIASIRRSKGLTRTLHRPLILSTFIQKGGTAKTTTSVNFAMYLGFKGLRVLVVDNDPQGDATSMFGYDPDLTEKEVTEAGLSADRFVKGSLGNVIGISSLFPPMTLADVVKKPFGEFGPHLLPAEIGLEDMEVALSAANNSDFRYAQFFNKGRKGELKQADLSCYDVILIDNAPSGSLMTRNSMVASDMVLCPIRMDKFSCRALERLAGRLSTFAEEYQRCPQVAAIPTMFVKNRPRAIAHIAKISEMFPGNVTDSKLFQSEDYGKALELGLPLLAWQSASENSAGALRQVFGELLDRLLEIR